MEADTPALLQNGRLNVAWIPPRVFVATLSWQVVACLTQCGVPQPIAVIRQTIRDLLLGDAKPCQGGIVLDRRFWRRFAAKSARRCSVQLAEECRQRVEFVLGQVDLTETVERRWLDVPELSEQERAKLEAARVAEPCGQYIQPNRNCQPPLTLRRPRKGDSHQIWRSWRYWRRSLLPRHGTHWFPPVRRRAPS